MFFHVLLWNLHSDANPADVGEGMRRMQRENLADMKRLSFGRRAALTAAGPLPFGELRRGTGGMVPMSPSFDYFFLMDFEDNPAYRRYVDSDAHMDFVWETCAARWSRFSPSTTCTRKRYRPPEQPPAGPGPLSTSCTGPAIRRRPSFRPPRC